jgi:hypothetical protein
MTEGASYMMLTPMSAQCRKSSGCEEMASRYGGLTVSTLKKHKLRMGGPPVWGLA